MAFSQRRKQGDDGFLALDGVVAVRVVRHGRLLSASFVVAARWIPGTKVRTARVGEP
jgi:hypothetical protein